jgi:hypothetical protein
MNIREGQKYNKNFHAEAKFAGLYYLYPQKKVAPPLTKVAKKFS